MRLSRLTAILLVLFFFGFHSLDVSIGAFVPFCEPLTVSQQQKLQLQTEPKPKQQKPKVKTATSGRWMPFEATFYNLCCNKTASGRELEDGVTVSVDPNVIPLGSWIDIQYPDGTVERRRADDTGSAVKGNIIDVYMARPTDELLQLGRQHVHIKIISKETVK